MRRLLLPLLVTTVLALLAPALPTVAAADAGVVKAQRRLNALRCDAGPVDGRLGAHTRTALIRFQSRHRLQQSGALGPVTRKALYSPRAKRCDRRPVPPRSGAGRRIVISQHQNWVWLVGPRGGVQAQGGMVDNPRVLRKGTWRTGSYCGRPARVRLNRSTSGAYWLDHFVRFAPCGIGFHRIPRRMATGRQMHPDWYLGTSMVGASAGCVRVSRRMAVRIWRFTAGRRTTVRVV